MKQLNLSVKKVRQIFVVERCTNRLYRMSQNDGTYLR